MSPWVAFWAGWVAGGAALFVLFMVLDWLDVRRRG